MDSISAFAMGQANRHKELMVFDWDTAARRIRDTNTKNARAGLSSDWEWTGDTIFQDGNPVKRSDTYTYLASTWAKPELCLDGEITDCFIMKKDSPGWDSGTYWPLSALEILYDGNKEKAEEEYRRVNDVS